MSLARQSSFKFLVLQLETLHIWALVHPQDIVHLPLTELSGNITLRVALRLSKYQDSRENGHIFTMQTRSVCRLTLTYHKAVVSSKIGHVRLGARS